MAGFRKGHGLGESSGRKEGQRSGADLQERQDSSCRKGEVMKKLFILRKVTGEKVKRTWNARVACETARKYGLRLEIVEVRK